MSFVLIPAGEERVSASTASTSPCSETHCSITQYGLTVAYPLQQASKEHNSEAPPCCGTGEVLRSLQEPFSFTEPQVRDCQGSQLA